MRAYSSNAGVWKASSQGAVTSATQALRHRSLLATCAVSSQVTEESGRQRRREERLEGLTRPKYSVMVRSGEVMTATGSMTCMGLLAIFKAAVQWGLEDDGALQA
eukprot:scaffold1781_cov371-Pinguiococcus_pyrenoidosus.AAC.4